MTSINDILMYILTYFHKKSSLDGTLLTPQTLPIQLGFTAITDHWGQEKSCLAVVCFLAQRQSGFRSLSGPGPCRVRGWQVLCWPTLSLFLTAPLALPQSGQVPENRRPYHAVTQHIRSPPSWTGIFQFRPHRSLTIGPKVRSNFNSPHLWLRSTAASTFRVCEENSRPLQEHKTQTLEIRGVWRG
jgi:hypothetical protein